MNNFLGNIFRETADSTRDRATYQGASAVERATFGKVFGAIEAVLALIALIGCAVISSQSFAQNSNFLLYLCGILWLIPFLLVGVWLARFRYRVFIRVRGMISNLLGGR